MPICFGKQHVDRAPGVACAPRNCSVLSPGAQISLNALRKGAVVLIGSTQFAIQKKLDRERWQLENVVTGEWCVFSDHDLLDLFARNELVFVNNDTKQGNGSEARSLTGYSPDLIAAAQTRVQYLKEIDRRQPTALTGKALESLTSALAQRIGDARPPSPRTLSRDYRKCGTLQRPLRRGAECSS